MALTGTSLAMAAEEPALNVYNWSDYIDPYVLTLFEEEYGIRVNYDVYSSSEIVDTKLMTGNTGYDIIVHPLSFAGRLAPIGVFEEVDFDRLQNWHHMDPAILDLIQRYFGEEVPGVPYMWGTTGFSYNLDMVLERMPDAPLHSASLVFDPAVVSRFADCGVALLDDPTSVIPMALLYLGYPATSIEPAHLREVEELFGAIRPYIRYFSNEKMLVDMPNKEVCVAMSWSGDFSVAATRARDEGLDLNLGYSVPIEGSVVWFDAAFIPSGAPHPDNAHLFLDFLLRPEIIARISNFVRYANGNKSATPLVDKLMTSHPGIYPDATTLDRLYANKLLGPKKERRRMRSWTRIKSGL